MHASLFVKWNARWVVVGMLAQKQTWKMSNKFATLPDVRLTLSSLSPLCSHSVDDSTHNLIKRPFISNHSRPTHEMETVVRARLDIDVMSQKCSDYLLMIIYAIATGRAQKTPHWLKVRVVRLWSDCVKFEIQLIDWLGSQAESNNSGRNYWHRSRVFVFFKIGLANGLVLCNSIYILNAPHWRLIISGMISARLQNTNHIALYICATLNSTRWWLHFSVNCFSRFSSRNLKDIESLNKKFECGSRAEKLT